MFCIHKAEKSFIFLISDTVNGLFSCSLVYPSSEAWMIWLDVNDNYALGCVK